MLPAGDLWFFSLLLVVSLVIPLTGLFISRKWRVYVARQADIKRPLILASEEAARAELEASFGYGAVSVSENFHQCAVCYCPTTMRCASCIAVRYCSAKCQIIHWRQGHKEECHLPSVDKFSKFNKLNQIMPDLSGESQYTATSSSGLGISDICEGSVSGPSSSSSGFLGKTHESVAPTINDENESFRSTPKEGSNSASPDSGSSLKFSFNVSGTFTSCPQSSKMKAVRVEDDPQVAFAHTKVSDGVAFPENISLDAPKVIKSPPLNSEWPNHMECCSRNILQVPKPREAKPLSPSSLQSIFESGSISTNDPSVSSSTSSCSEKSVSGTVINVHSNALHPLKSTDAYSSHSRVHGVSSVKYGRIESSEANAAILAPVSSGSHNGEHGLKSSMLKVVDQFRASRVPKQYPFAVGNEVARKYSDKGLFPYESFVKLYNWDKIKLQPCGLVNCGNSCYVNAILQCLTFTPPLTAYFLRGLHSKECKRKGWCFSCEFESLILKAKDGKSPLSPIGILFQLQNIGSQLANGKEEDAHEFLRYAIDTMQSICLIDAGMDSSGCLEEETTLLGLTFGGYVRSKISCIKCQGKYKRYERMMDLTVEIKGDIGSLEEALRRFTATEILDGENKYQCSRCKSYEKAKKKLTILEAPNILTIALKRFQSGRFGKLDKVIRFPEILNLAPYMSGTSDKSPIYRLYAVVVHLDTMNTAFSGHYVCYVKNMQNKWFKIDDNIVTSADLDQVLTERAYILLYARCSPRAPRLIRSSNKAIPRSVNPKGLSRWRFPTSSNVYKFYHGSIHPDISGSVESFYSKYNLLQRISRRESSSDGSVFSINSGEGSYCTDSTLDSTSTNDLWDSMCSRSRSRSRSRSGSNSSRSSMSCERNSGSSSSSSSGSSRSRSRSGLGRRRKT